MISCIMVGLGGALGAILRYLMGLIPIRNNFPFITLFINIIGAIVIGMVSSYSERHIQMNPTTLLFLKTGLCGGFTTFSTFSLESFGLIEQHRYINVTLYIIASVLLCIIGIGLGKKIISYL